mgnify:CR=1 FL=1
MASERGISGLPWRDIAAWAWRCLLAVLVFLWSQQNDRVKALEGHDVERGNAITVLDTLMPDVAARLEKIDVRLGEVEAAISNLRADLARHEGEVSRR